MTLLKVKNVEKFYGNENVMTKALNNLSFQVENGEFISIMGPSGSGKTTLLNCVSTLDSVTAGAILLEGIDITKLSDEEISVFRANKLGFVFQDSNLLDTLTIEENIALPLAINNYNPKTIDDKVKKIALRLNIVDSLKKYPYEVSGGQKQRAAIARAIISNPQLLVADEPTGALDSKAAIQLMKMLVSLNVEYKTTILLVTHDPLIASFSSRVLFVKDGKIFNEIIKGQYSNESFYEQILDVLSVLNIRG